ncbi:MAG TPA: hypothetical protein VFE53_05205 [Mucilaginibacter sp.]|jgi:hypothetical protein|nr:hypothetical protein [Mucilaginibacter sp.]
MEEKEISSAEESLQIIESMINKAKNTVADNSFLFLLWGWLAFTASLAQFILKIVFNYPHHYYTWALLLVALLVSVSRLKKGSRVNGSKTYIDYTIENLWICVIASYILFTLIFFRIGWLHSYTFYIFLMSLSSFLTGKLLNFRSLVMGATGGGFLALLSTFMNYDYDILACGLGVLVSYIIPGHLLRSRFKKSRHAI